MKKMILKSFLAFGLALMFVQCADKNAQTSKAAAAPQQAVAGTSNMKIAYVEIDSLLSKYDLWNDLNEQMIQKEENIRTALNEKAKKLDGEMKEFQRKIQNNGFVSQERAQQEAQRLQKKEQDLQALQQKLTGELAAENQKNTMALRDSINAFLKVYNAEKKYDFIISNAGADNLLYANPAFNITKEVVDGLNARYAIKKK